MVQVNVSPAEGVWSVRTADGLVVESRNAKALTEGAMAPVIYFPREDVAMALMERSDTTTTCPHKGTASYYSYVGPSATMDDVAWTYEDVTNPDIKAIEGHLAFYSDKVAVEQI
ncbi:DUF427 domain-containing protein [Jannaschia rubra]|uniref:DUF427 domain-containing protein n=1 Tax=Jannaschia rubra TaxID=282197 RepID=A0A0M6XNP2_9RHOB|nr:DUF427 domain-containing protein [Jannaschia rubra]CTQ31725.1 hypothetical protein JAN5088_00484 [Jannaschia rubra]SFG55442.1 Uncharacterized conserved protein, DUF427 family [Jannaschia rubra]